MTTTCRVRETHHPLPVAVRFTHPTKDHSLSGVRDDGPLMHGNG